MSIDIGKGRREEETIKGKKAIKEWTKAATNEEKNEGKMKKGREHLTIETRRN